MNRPDHEKLFQIASQQGGYFTARQAHQSGFTKYLVRHHARSGRFVRVQRGLYRLRQFPASAQDHVIEAWLAAGPDAAVSHESALSLHGLTDVIPSTVHLTVPRTHRWVGRRVPEGVTLHTSTRSLSREDIVTSGPLQVIAPARSIIDAAESGTGPEQIILAVRQALDRGFTTRRQLLELLEGRSQRIGALIQRALEEAASS
jgi:predicted transcriptional regulator of viral defense system